MIGLKEKRNGKISASFIIKMIKSGAMTFRCHTSMLIFFYADAHLDGSSMFNAVICIWAV